MANHKPQPGEPIRYWHPVKGGWYSGFVVSVGRKWARLRIKTPRGDVKVIRVPVTAFEVRSSSADPA